MQPHSTIAEIREIAESMPKEAQRELERHAGVLRRYLEVGGPIALIAFMLVSAEVIESGAAQPEGAA
jgi:hypothetical protein